MKATRARKSRSPRPPAGLVAMMSLLKQEGHTNAAPEYYARGAYPLALRVIRELRGADFKREWDSLDNAAVEMFPSLEGETPTDSTCTLSGFYVGVAVAWLLLQDVNGGAR